MDRIALQAESPPAAPEMAGSRLDFIESRLHRHRAGANGQRRAVLALRIRPRGVPRGLCGNLGDDV